MTPDSIAEAFEGLLERAAAADAASWPAIYRDYNDLEARVRGEGKRRRYAYTKDMRDPTQEALDKEYREEWLPALEQGASRFTDLLLASPHKEALSQVHGPQLLRVLEVDQPGMAPVNADLRLQARQLSQRYDKTCSEGAVTIGGETLTLAQARGKTTSQDPALRKEAWLAWRGWHRDNRDTLAEIFDQLVKRRHAMGLNLGHSNFLPLGYAGMGRTDFGPEESRAFREAVRKHAVPLLAKIREGQRTALGQETVPPWDVGYHPQLSLPDGVAKPIDEQLDKAQTVFDRLSPKLAKHFSFMRENGLIDLENRPGKAAGAYCTAFPDEGKVAIFCNSVGSERDISTLFHEMGHAFQSWESQWIDAVALRWPTMESAEVHSMGMEFLSLPLLDAFFEPGHAQRFARARWKKAVELLCYVSVVDAFQHWVYENPDATPDDRDARWVELQTAYQPGEDWSGEAASYQATRWYAQLHIFRFPFYYIDYALAEMGAMQLALMADRDHEQGLATYLELCRLGGTGSMMELLGKAGLRSPFDESLMGDLMAHAASTLNL